METNMKREEKVTYEPTTILEKFKDYEDVRGIFLSCQIPNWKDALIDIKKIATTSQMYIAPITTEDKEEFLDVVLEGAKKNHEIYQKALELCRRRGLDCCKIVECIGMYSTQQETNQRKKNQELERLLEKYEITLIHSKEENADSIQITEEDINRIETTMNRSLEATKKLLAQANNAATYFSLNDETYYLDLISQEIVFPKPKKKPKTSPKEIIKK